MRRTLYVSVKRVGDVLAATIGLAVLVIAGLPIAVAVRLSTGSPVLFLQERLGRNEEAIRVPKFRSMTDSRGPDGQPLPDAARLTKMGRFLRSSSLDEIPQVISVLKGDLSVVGPRPLLVEYLPYYTADERQRHSVRPGITGLAQVRGRNNLSWDDRLSLDVEYVRCMSLKLDLSILLATVAKVVLRRDVAIVPGLKGQRLDVERRGLAVNK